MIELHLLLCLWVSSGARLCELSEPVIARFQTAENCKTAAINLEATHTFLRTECRPEKAKD